MAAALTPVWALSRKNSGTPSAEAYELPFCQVQQYLGLDRVQILGYGDVCHVDFTSNVIVLFHSGASSAPGIVRPSALSHLSMPCRLPVPRSASRQRADLRRLRCPAYR